VQKTTIQASFLAIDPRNGYVKAWVGSRDFEQDGFDHVQQARRQPGSTFKPFVYGEAFRQGFSPDDSLVDEAVEIAVDDPDSHVPPSDFSDPFPVADRLHGNAVGIQTQSERLPDSVDRRLVLRCEHRCAAGAPVDSTFGGAFRGRISTFGRE